MTQVLERDERTEQRPDEPAGYGLPPAGWYADTLSGTWLRYWTGTEWTDHTQPVAPPPARRVVAAPAAAVAAVPAPAGGAMATVSAEGDDPGADGGSQPAARATLSESARLAVLVVLALVAGVAVAALGILFTT
jgi:hypothetical protein